jgi:opacity protein-like surface antigen
MHKTISFKKIRKYSGRVVSVAAMLIAFAGAAFAQEGEHKWTANVGVGFTPLVGALNQRLDNGWHISFGGGYHLTERFSLGGQIMYNGLGVSRGVLNELAVPDGNAHLWAFTVEPRLDFAPRSKLAPYIVGGVGYYRRVVEFTQPSVAAVVVFDPFFFDFFPALIPADQVIGRVIRDGIGGNAGIGFQIPVGHSAKIFTEARYHYSNGGGIPTRMIPLTIGVRF